MRSHLRRLVRRSPGPPLAFSVGLQQERTSLAWERTAMALMVAGTLLARYAAGGEVWVVAGAGLVLAAGGGLLLVWTGVHYDDLHQTLRDGTAVDHHRLVKTVALAATTVTATGLGLSLWLALAV